MKAVRCWLKRWVLWHMPCPVHGTAHTWMSLDPDCSWDAGMITRCSACGDRWVGDVKRSEGRLSPAPFSTPRQGGRT